MVAVAGITKLSVLARLLSSSDFGLMALVVSVMGMLHLLNDVGLGAALLHKRQISSEEFSSVYWFNWGVSIGMYILLWVLTPTVVWFYKQPELYTLLPLAGLGLIFSGLGYHFKITEQKNLRFRNISLIEISGSFLSLVVAVLMALNGFGVYSLLYSLLVQSVFVNIVYFVRGLSGERLLFCFSWSLARPFVRMGGFQMGGQIANIFNKDLDILLIGKFFSPETLGIYSLARQLVQKPIAVLMPVIVRVGTPVLAGFNDNAEKIKHYFLRIVKLVSLFSLPTYLGLAIFAEYAIRVVYGEGYESMVPVFRILCLYMILRNPMSPVGILTTATGRTDLEFSWNMLTLLVTPIFVFVGVGYHIEGVALALTASMALLFLPFWAILVRRCSTVSLREYSTAVFLPFWRVKV